MTTIQASPTTELDRLCVETIRMLSVDAVEHAKSGHPGTPMALAPIGYLLYTRVMRHSPQHPDWPDRDRFVLSAGHASMLLYSLLYLTGYGLSLKDIKRFRQLGSPCAGHPEYLEEPHEDRPQPHPRAQSAREPPPRYAAGSQGPAEAERILLPGHDWRAI